MGKQAPVVTMPKVSGCLVESSESAVAVGRTPDKTQLTFFKDLGWVGACTMNWFVYGLKLIKSVVNSCLQCLCSVFAVHRKWVRKQSYP